MCSLGYGRRSWPRRERIEASKMLQVKLNGSCPPRPSLSYDAHDCVVVDVSRTSKPSRNTVGNNKLLTYGANEGVSDRENSETVEEFYDCDNGEHSSNFRARGWWGFERKSEKCLEGRSQSWRPSRFGKADRIDVFASIWSSFPGSRFFAVIENVKYAPLVSDECVTRVVLVVSGH